MKSLFVIVSIAFLALEGNVHADAMPPPVVLRDLGPIPIAISGIALSLAIGLGGLTAARLRGTRGISAGRIVGALAILLVTSVAMLWSIPRHIPRDTRVPGRDTLRPSAEDLAIVASFLAVAPDAGFPPCVPWAPLLVTRVDDSRGRLVLIDLGGPRNR